LVKTKDRQTVGSLKMTKQSANHAAFQIFCLLLTMTINPWLNRLTVLALLAMVYAAGHDAGRIAAVQAHNNHPACQQNLKP
jgi:hypothetical protein